MSKTIDQKVVEMKFDNSNFEKNAQTSMSTLEKLKEKLNLTGASKGLEQINNAAKNNNIGAIGDSAEKVGSKFSAMEVIGVTALMNITNTAVDAGKRMVKALTIDPIKTGFNEYELKMGSVQTIMASTGETLETVNQYLGELNTYSDKTIYSFSDMTNSIGKFTNAGVKLEDAVLAIKGISNEAAVSGANANEASRAMYNFAQALSAGYVKLIDWKSIENANMATVEFKDQLIQSAVACGTLTKAGDGMYKTLKGNTLNATKNFNDTLQDQWMTTEVLVSTLRKYADETTEIGKKAYASAQDVKTFSMMCDTLKEAAQSGWATSWEIIFGDFYEAKDLWTGMANSIGAVIDKMSDARNNFLKNAFWEPWKIAAEYVNEAGIETKKFKKDLLDTANAHAKATDKMAEGEKSFDKALKNGKITKEVVIETLKKYTGTTKEANKSTEDMSAKLKKFQKIVDQVWLGSYGNGVKRVEALTKAGYKYEEVQGLVNKCVNGYRLKLEDLSASQLKSIGYTDEQVDAIQKLSEQAQTTGTDFNTLIENLSRPSGRELVLETVNNLLREFAKITDAAKEAWDDVFGDANFSEEFYKLLEYLNELSESFVITSEQANNFKDIFAGLLSLFNLAYTVTGISLVSTLKILNAVLKLFGTDLSSILAQVARLITKFSEWATQNTVWWGYIDNLAKIIYALVDGVYRCVKAFANLEVVTEFVSKLFKKIGNLFGGINFKDAENNIDRIASIITAFFDNLEKKISSITSFGGKLESIGEDIINGLNRGLGDGAKNIIENIREIAKNLIKEFCAVLGIASPSKVFIAIGGFIVAGLIYGIKDSASLIGTSVQSIVTSVFEIIGDTIKKGIPYTIDLVETLGSKLLEGFKASSVDFGTLFVVGTMITVAFFMKKILNILEKLTGVTSPLEKLGDLFGGLTSLLGEFQKNVKAKRINMYAESLKSVAISVGILAASLYLLSKIKIKDALPAVGMMVGLIAGLVVILKMASKLENPVDFVKLSVFAISLSIAIRLMARTVKDLSEVNWKKGTFGLISMLVMLGTMALVLKSFNKITGAGTATSMGKAVKLIGKISFAFIAMALAIKIIQTIPPEGIAKGLLVIGGMTLMMYKLIAVSKIAGVNADKAGIMFRKFAVSVGILAIAMKIIGGLNTSDIAKGFLVITGIERLFIHFINSIRVLKKGEVVKGGSTFIAMSVSIGLLAIAIKMIAGIPTGDIVKGLIVIAGIELLFKNFINACTYGANAAKAGMLLIGMSVAIGILVTTLLIINRISTKDLARGMLVIAGFELMFASLIKIVKDSGIFADRLAKLLTKISIAILIMVAAISILTLLNPKKVAIATASIDSIIISFSVLLMACKIAEKTGGMAKTIIALMIVVGGLAGVIYLLSTIDSKSAITSSVSISTVLITLVSAMKILSTTNGIVTPKMIVTVALMGLILGEIVGVFFIMSKLDIRPSLESSAALVILLIGLAKVCYMISGLQMPLSAAAKSMLYFGVFIAGLSAIIALLGALYRAPQVKDLIEDGGKLLKAVGTAIGGLIGGLIGGIASGASDSLPAIGANLSSFWKNASGFINGVKGISPEVGEGVKNLADAVLTFTKAGIKDAVAGFFIGSSSLDNFAGTLESFGDGLQKFSNKVSGVDPSSMKGALDAAKTVAEIASVIPNSGGLVSLFTGDNRLDSFGYQLSSFGEYIKAFSDSVSGMGDNSDSLDAAVKTTNSLAKLADTLPNVGGLFSWITGEVDLKGFGSQLKSYGKSLMDFSESVSGLNADPIKNSIAASEGLVKLANNLPKFGGLFDFLDGSKDFSIFGAQLKSYGESLRKYSVSVLDLDTDSITKSIGASEGLIKLGDKLPQTGGIFSIFDGSKDFATFGEQLWMYGACLKKYSENVVGIDTEAILNSTKATRGLALLAKFLPKTEGLFGMFSGGKMNLSEFGSKLKSFGSSLKAYSASASGINAEAVSSSVSSAKTLVNFIKSLNNLDTVGVSSFKTAISELGKVSVNSVVKSFSGNTEKLSNVGAKMIRSVSNGMIGARKYLTTAASSISKTITLSIKTKSGELRTAGKSLVTAFANSMINSSSKAKVAGKNIGNAAIVGVKEKYNGMHGAGSYLVSGFVNGIDENIWRAEAKSRAMAEAAKEAAKDELDEHSPSKEFYRIGDFAGLGFVNALGTYADKAYNKSAEMASSAKKGLKDAISRISNFISDGVDTNPTITPVLDLSSVSSGMKTMNGMLDMGSTIGVSANVSAINSMMNDRIQNGPNSDLINAINRLRSDLGNIGGDTYTINGVTYDDGSNITDAVKTLVRAAKVERRV